MPISVRSPLCSRFGKQSNNPLRAFVAPAPRPGANLPEERGLFSVDVPAGKLIALSVGHHAIATLTLTVFCFNVS